MTRLWVRVLWVAFGVLAVSIIAIVGISAAALYTASFEPWRRAQAEVLLNDALGLNTKVSGTVEVGFGLTPRVVISDVSSERTEAVSDLKSASAKKVDFNVSLLSLFSGDAVLISLFVDGLSVDIDLPEGRTDRRPGDPGAFLHDFVRMPFSANLSLQNFRLNYQDRETGWNAQYKFDRFGVHRQARTVLVKGVGHIHDRPLELTGKIEPSGSSGNQHAFSFSAKQSGLTVELSGVYQTANLADTIDAAIKAHSASLSDLLDVYNVEHSFDGKGDLTFSLSGPLGAARISALDLSLTLGAGDTFLLTGSIDDAVKRSGIDLHMKSSLVPPPSTPGAQKPLYDLNITGFSGHIAGSIDALLVRDLRIVTSSLKAQLHEIGPISAERVWKDPQGRVGLYDVKVLAGPGERPTVRIRGNVKDVLKFQGVDLQGAIDFQTADALGLEAEDKAALLGRLQGNVAVSDADGSIGIESLKAQVTETDLLSMSVEFVFDDLRAKDELTFKTSLNIPSFKKFSAALGDDVEELGAATFDGTISGSDEHLKANGVTVVGKTTLTGTLVGSNADGRPLLTGSVSTPLLHLEDVEKIVSVRSVYITNSDDEDEGDQDVLDLSKIENTIEVDMQIEVEKIDGGGRDASKISGRVTYKDDVVGLDNVTMRYLGGKASTSGKINTRGGVNSFSLVGDVDDLRIGTVLKRLRLTVPVSGTLGMHFALTSKGDDADSISKSLGGHLAASLRHGKIGTSLLDLAGLNFPTWLFSRHSKSGEADLVCAIAPFSFVNGRGTTRSLVLETRDVQVRGAGYIDFGKNAISMRFRPRPLRAQFIDIVKPFSIKGSLSKPHLNLEGAPIAGLAAEVITFPLNLIGTLLEPLESGSSHVPCRRVGREVGR
ncbi:MAG: AsmA-like C-terminal region-containing protein [Hyphomicrobium sp.]